MTVPRAVAPPIPVALAAVAAATDRLLATVDGMSEADFAAPSLLPGWSRAHVLAHLALNSKGVAGALTKLHQVDRLPIYASDRRRDADIARLAAQAPAHIADRVAVGAAVLAQHLGGGPTPEDALESVGQAGAVAASSTRRPAATSPTPFADAVADHAAAVAAWHPEGTIERTPGGRVVAATEIPYMRWREVEIHHADLGLAYGPGDWSADFTAFLYASAAYDRDGEVAMTLAATDGQHVELAGGGPAPIITGAMAELAYWLIGRGTGTGLTASGPLPGLGPWTRRP